MKVAFGNDQAAYEMRDALVAHIKELGHDVIDFGARPEEGSVDYPDYAKKVAEAVKNGEAERGVLICGSGIGMCMAANKVHSVRCAVCTDVYAAEMTRRHNNANVLAIRSREMDLETNLKIIDTFLSTEADPEERHKRRVDKISEIEQES